MAAGGTMLETLIQDLRYAARAMTRARAANDRPVMTLALGIGGAPTCSWRCR